MVVSIMKVIELFATIYRVHELNYESKWRLAL